MKKIFLLIGMVVLLQFLNSCYAGYVREEPVYHTYSRPVRPSNDYIWIDGGWIWNKGTRTYQQDNGHWGRHDEGRGKAKGHWKKNKHGSRWERDND